MSNKTKKQLLLNLPYFIAGLVCTNLGEAWRIAEGADMSEKLLGFLSALGAAFSNPMPSLHPMDLLIGVCCGAGLRLAVYLKGKNAKKYRHGMEYGSARWGTQKDIEPFEDPVFANNVILTRTERLMMGNRPKNPANARNKNVLVVGGSGSGKTRFWLKPNLLQCHSSYVVTDPKGDIVIDCGQALLKNGYSIRIFNTINFRKSIKGFQSDIRMVAAHPLPEEGFCGMEVNGTRFTEKAEAGEAILAVCKANRSLEPVPLGSYRGFKMELAFDSFQKEYQVLLKSEMTHRVPIGTSAAGNIQRLDNALAGIPARMEKAEQQLDNLRSQQEAAQAELGKPFPQEAELAEKCARLAELDALLNMDDRGNDDPNREETTEKPSVLAELRDRAGRIPPMTHRDEEVAL